MRFESGWPHLNIQTSSGCIQQAFGFYGLSGISQNENSLPIMQIEVRTELD